MDEGYIKYRSFWTKKFIRVDNALFRELNRWRNEFYRRNWIGMYDSGIGFGNISMRLDEKRFLISGSATGGVAEADIRHYALVTDFSIDENSVQSEGASEASSESLTHAALYECDTDICSVLHIHDRQIWEKYRNRIPTTDAAVSYGTHQMARAIQQCCKEINARQGVMVMGGHPEGIIAFGPDFESILTGLTQLRVK